MKTFYVDLTVTVSRMVTVQADTAEEAETLALKGRGEVYEESESETTVNSVEEDE